jgi:cobalt/nickel transport system permease protein
LHISEGVLAPVVIVGGALAAAAGVGLGLKKLDYERIPDTAVLTSAFFVASLVHIPVGPASVHMALNGLVGLLLGWCAAPAILAALFLQAILFQFGGLTTLGVNTFVMAAPAVFVHYAFGPLARSERGAVAASGAFLAGSVAVGFSSVLMALALAASGDVFKNVARMVIIAHIPVMIIEGIVTSFCVTFLRKVKPEILENGI